MFRLLNLHFVIDDYLLSDRILQGGENDMTPTVLKQKIRGKGITDTTDPDNKMPVFRQSTNYGKHPLFHMQYNHITHRYIFQH